MTTTATRAVHVEHCTGTVLGIDVRDPGDRTDAIADVVCWLHHVDGVLSRYQPGSDISRLQRRELRLTDADPDVAVVLDLCADVQRETGGHFSSLAHGRVDPTGLVKDWAVEAASRRLRDRKVGCRVQESWQRGLCGAGPVRRAGASGRRRPPPGTQRGLTRPAGTSLVRASLTAWASPLIEGAAGALCPAGASRSDRSEVVGCD